MCKGTEYNKSKVKLSWYHRPGVCLANLRGSQGPPSSILLSRRVGGRNLARNDYPSSSVLLLALRIWVTYSESKHCCSCTERQKYHILEAKQHCPKQHRCPVKKTGVLILICGIAIHTKAPCWKTLKNSGTTSANFVFECNVDKIKKKSGEFLK